MSLDIGKILLRLAQTRDKVFIYKGEEVPMERVFAMDGGIPVLVRRANLLADFLFGEKLKVAFADDPESLSGERAEVEAEQYTFVLLMMLYDVVEELFVTAGAAREVQLN